MQKLEKMMIPRCICIVTIVLILISVYYVDGQPRRILLDTDVDVDDVLAMLYLLKLDRSIYELEAITISTNAWTNAGHAVNQVYDLLYMMGRDDIAVGVGGEGGILEDSTILPNVGGYLPLIEQGLGTAGNCRYSQVIPLGLRGKLDIDTKYGIRNAFLPQGGRSYIPLQQPTTQQVMIDKISAGRITVLSTGSTTNLAIFLMTNPQLKKNIDRIYILGGSLGPRHVACPTISTSSCPSGNVYTGDSTAPDTEYNFFSDPFAAYQVIHSGIPVTLVPLGATDTIPITPEFLEEFEKNQKTFEGQYIFKALKLMRDTWITDQFYDIFFMWDSFLAGVATSTMLKENNKHGQNEFADMEYKNITVITSNEPYGISDGSNPFFDGCREPMFHLKENGLHSGHIFTRPGDPFCIARNGCKDGYTQQVTGPEGVPVLVAVRAKPNCDKKSKLNKAFYAHFLDVINQPQQTGKFNFTTQFPHYRDVANLPDFKGRTLGNTVVFDMDMSPGDFLALIYLLKVPVETIHLKAILITPNGWANAATIDITYDLLHIMNRDDILVGLGDLYAMNQTYPTFESIGSCKYRRVIPHGAGGFLDSDTLYGFAHDLARSPRRYTAENSVSHGAPRDTDHPELRQPLAREVWDSVIGSLEPGSKVTVLTNGPLTNLAQIILSNKKSTSQIQEVIVVGGHISQSVCDEGDVINVPDNKYTELNMFLDPLAAKAVFDSGLNITLVPLGVQRGVRQFDLGLQALSSEKTPEAAFATVLLSTLDRLKKVDPRYHQVDMFMGEILGSAILAGHKSFLRTTAYEQNKVKVLATGNQSEDGRMIIDQNRPNSVRVLKSVGPHDFYDTFAKRLGANEQSSETRSFFVTSREKY